MTLTPEFEGVVGSSWRESTPWWPPDPVVPTDAPNVVIVVLDDVGYAQLGCYGSDISTPNIDAVAAGGVQLANFHTTGLCSPTRACVLTGRNHHTNAMGRIADLALGYPGYYGDIPRENGFLPEILAEHGYASIAVGKWHLTPEDETHAAASRASWPCGRGFQRWYGFHGGEVHQFVPTIWQDNTAVDPPRRPEEGYHLSEDLADRAIRYLGEIRTAEPDKPFFAYFATGACHSPHHAPPEWIDRYKGQFDEGWDVWRDKTFARQKEMGLVAPNTQLTPRPSWVPEFSSLRAEDQAVAARFMECFAGYLSHADAQIGRVLDFINQLGEADNTIVLVMSDNGASAEGGMKGSINDARIHNGEPAGRRELRARINEIGTESAHNNYPWGWTMAGNTPLRRWKREVHEGGVADPCVIKWPRAISARGEIRHQFTHAIDVLPTILELIGIVAPEKIRDVEQSPIEGTSFSYLFNDANAPGQHTTQYFEMFGSRAIHHDGWKAVTFKPLAHMYDDGLDPEAPFADDVWELYHVAEDFSEVNNLAAAEPERLAAMVELWWREARQHQVLPLDNRPMAALLNPRRPFSDRRRAVFWPGGEVLPEQVGISVYRRNHTITVPLAVSETLGYPPAGVLLALGTVLGGWSLHLLDGRVRYVSNFLGSNVTVIESDEIVTPGEHTVGFSFSTQGEGGIATLWLDGKVVGEGSIERVTLFRHSISGAGYTCGWEQGPAVGPGYRAPFRCTAQIQKVIVEVDGPIVHDPKAEFEAIMAEQ